MNTKDQIIISVDSNIKKDFRIACIDDNKTMTDKILELIKEYLQNRK